MVYDKNGKVINSSKKPIKSAFDKTIFSKSPNKCKNEKIADICFTINGTPLELTFKMDSYWDRAYLTYPGTGAMIEIPEDEKDYPLYQILEELLDEPFEFDDVTLTDVYAAHQINSSKKPIKSSKEIISNKEPADLDMAYQLEGYIESDGQLYTQMIVPVIKNLERKVKKGIYDYDKSLIMWERVADEGAKRYIKELGGPAYNVATRKEVAKKLSSYYEENYMGDNPIESSKQINSSWEEDVDFVVDQFMDEWMEKHPDSTTEECAAARKKYHDWVYERV